MIKLDKAQNSYKIEVDGILNPIDYLQTSIFKVFAQEINTGIIQWTTLDTQSLSYTK